MKKLTKSIAVICSLLFACFTLVACGNKDINDNGNNKGLVDTSANYQPLDDSFNDQVAVSGCTSAMSNDSLKDGETYAIRLVYTAITTLSDGTLTSMTEEITGNIAESGDFSLDSKSTLTETNYSFNSSIIYDASERTLYIDYMGRSKYTTTVVEGENPFAAQYINYVFPFTFDQINPKGFKTLIDNLTKKPDESRTITGFARTNSHIKMRYEGTSSIIIPDIEADCTFYTVCNINEMETQVGKWEVFDFAGAKVEISFNNGNLNYIGFLEIAKSTTNAKTLTDAEKTQYLTQAE